MRRRPIDNKALSLLERMVSNSSACEMLGADAGCVFMRNLERFLNILNFTWILLELIVDFIVF